MLKRILVTGGSGFIGTNCVAEAIARGWECVNIDIKEPLAGAHKSYFRKVDLLDQAGISTVIDDFRPNYIVHLAAKTGMDETKFSDFSANTDGVENLLRAAHRAGSVQRIVVASSLLVCRNGYLPSTDTDYCPPNLYGQSKVETENRTRAFDPTSLQWIIVRPTSVWGPWFDGGYRKFFQMIQKGAYVHPGKAGIVKPQTFVGNCVHMMMTMLQAAPEKVVGRTFYLSDWPDRTLREWAELINKAFGARSIRSLPLPLMRGIAAGGDLLKLLGVEEPTLTSFRLKNMLTEAHYPSERTEEVVGKLPYTLEDGVRITVEWIKSQQCCGSALRETQSENPH